MIRKSLIALALGLTVAAAAAPAARADVDIDIKINLGYGGFYGRNITCKTGARIVDQRFNNVKIRDCSGANYRYHGRRNGKNYLINVSRSTGRITAVTRVWN